MEENPYKSPSEPQAIDIHEGSPLSADNLRAMAKTFVAFVVLACLGMAIIGAFIVLCLSLQAG
jgi:hypothetical protein